MYTWTSRKTFQLGGKNFNNSETIQGVGLEAVEQSIPVAWTGTLTVRTDNNTGTVTMASASHIITTGARVDIYWENADGTLGLQRASTVGTVSGTSVPIDLGIGDNLPLAGSTVQVAISQQYAFSFLGNNIAALAVGGDGRCCIVIASGTVTEELFKRFDAAGAYGWSQNDSEANPIAGDTITFVYMSQASPTAAVAVRASVLKKT